MQALVRVIGRWSLAALMLNTIIGSSVFGLPALIAAQVGALSPVGFVIAALGVGLIAACLAEVGSQFRATGGPYLYAREAFGRFVAIEIGWLTWLSRITASAAGANLFVSYLTPFVPSAESWQSMRALIITSLIACLAALNYRGVAAGARFSNVVTLAKLGVLFIFIGAGLAALLLEPGLRVRPEALTMTTSRWLDGLLLMTVAFGGFEAALFPSGESRDPRHDVPVALTAALVVATVTYVGMQYVVIHTLADPSGSTKPVADAAHRFLGSGGVPFIAGGALLSVVGYLGANMLHTPRIVFAMGEQGDVPRFLARVHPRFRTPHITIVIFATALAVFAVLGSYRWNVTVTAVSRMFIYGSIAAALPVLRKRQPDANAFRLPGGGLVSVLALVFTAALATRVDLGGLAVALGTFTLGGLNWIWARQPR